MFVAEKAPLEICGKQNVYGSIKSIISKSSHQLSPISLCFWFSTHYCLPVVNMPTLQLLCNKIKVGLHLGMSSEKLCVSKTKYYVVECFDLTIQANCAIFPLVLLDKLSLFFQLTFKIGWSPTHREHFTCNIAVIFYI